MPMTIEADAADSGWTIGNRPVANPRIHLREFDGGIDR